MNLGTPVPSFTPQQVCVLSEMTYDLLWLRAPQSGYIWVSGNPHVFILALGIMGDPSSNKISELGYPGTLLDPQQVCVLS